MWLQGTCCTTLLDQAGRCCASGTLDECGVCDGDSTSCAMHIALQLALNTSTAAAAAPETSTWAHVTAAVAQAAGLGLEAATLISAQRLGGGLSTGQQGAWGLDTWQVLVGLQGAGSVVPYGWTLGSVLPAVMALINTDGAAASDIPAAAVVAKASQSRRLAGGVQDASTNSVAGAGSGAGASLPAGMLLTEVVGMQRVGTCGNGVCEVGETQWDNPWTSHTYDLSGSSSDLNPSYPATSSDSARLGGPLAVLPGTWAPCPADCPLALHSCPTPEPSTRTTLGLVGNASLECGGRGTCMRASGQCACYKG